jgi:hypothetical protein
LPGGYPLGQGVPLDELAIDTSSVVTIRPLPTAKSRIPAGVVGHDPSPSAPATRGAALSVYHEEALSNVPESSEHNVNTSGDETSAPRIDSGPSGHTAPTPATVLPNPTKAASSADGVHRFTIVNQKALRKVEAVKAKKQSACMLLVSTEICLIGRKLIGTRFLANSRQGVQYAVILEYTVGQDQMRCLRETYYKSDLYAV